ncbi:G-ACD-00290 [African swine fever virus]|nr:G-ACD-00290 [African swine fever virus]
MFDLSSILIRGGGSL